MSIVPHPALAEHPALPPFPAAPPALQPLLLAWLAPLLTWVSALLYQTVLTRCASHPLVRLHAAYDPAPVVRACAAYYHTAGPGTPPTYSVDTLVRAEIVRVWAGSCSDRVLEQLLAAHLLARWYVGLPLLGPTPDHATLARFHAWLTLQQPRALFADILAFLDRVDPEDPAATPQIADTFALASPAAPTSPSEILRGLTAQTVACWRTTAPPALPDPLAALDLTPLLTRPHLYTPEQRLVALRQAVTTATAVQAALTPHLPALAPPARAALQGLLDLLTKVSTDETSTDPTGRLIERPFGQKGSYRLGSPVDTEATFRKHEPKPAVFGTNAAIATTATRIRAAVALSGCTPDSEAPVALLAQQQQGGLPLPPALIMDQAGGHGKTRAQVETVSGGQTQMVARIPVAGGADPTRYGPADFRLSADGTECSCPQGVVSRKAYPSGAGDGVHFRFTAAQCATCPLRAKCRTPDSAPKSHRTVYISPYQAHLVAAAAFNHTEVGKELLGERWRVEPTIAWLVRYDGARRARRVGRAAAQLHLYQACALRNLWRWLGRVARRGTAVRPTVAVA